ncbi:hypothetical protein [Listeria seeligeri]|uniref:hypothetical protein n=1 Tax=Listeria seeligeri TaxID=1640 RepID=UPI0022EAA54F|nr:hypothetical protein [Listeria seeligeri]
MENSYPIKIKNQLIFGRDKIWLISMHQNNNKLTLTVEIDLEEKSMLLNIVFEGIVFYSSTELDTYEKSKWSSSWLNSQSNFEVVQGSDLMKERVEIRSDYNRQDFTHYRISTCDYIIDVIAKNYQLEEVDK